ncbi:hypothetical protein PY254_14925 [Rhodanobacter sp. AS-Z3]|uniref:hypothetical protein n=1 Tax=Rhodanobacter sp. AS-Z3 TaxID=3031330 RepID=UPI00247ABC35|nr:hypothetical protein [Rhodanobacter sp. AS-Z3]WEN14508.1 hypothetical protein PY254_14925 [Rhodanobacter sp. AS-Z3]
MTHRITDLTISVLACVIAVLLSWPFWRSYAYWPESHLAWLIYFVTGFVLAVYVFYVFIGSLRILFLHDTQEQGTAATDKAKIS